MKGSTMNFSQPIEQQKNGTRRFFLGVSVVTGCLAIGIAAFAVQHRHLTLPHTNGKPLGELRAISVREESNGLDFPATPFSAIETTAGVYQVAGAVSGKFGERVTLFQGTQGSVVCISDTCYPTAR